MPSRMAISVGIEPRTGVQFREVDVSRSASAARDLVRRGGQMGVPVIEIDGQPVVDCDRVQIDRLLGLRRRTGGSRQGS